MNTGTPLNYMMLENTDEKQSNSALATLSLVRSIGTAIAPAIMVGFIAHAGGLVQNNVMNLLPKEVSVSSLPYMQDITDELNKLKNNEQMKDKLSGINMPDLSSMTKMKINMNGNSNYKMPADLIELMQNSDVTNITANTVTLSERMFNKMTPDVIKNIQTGIGKGIDGINTGKTQMEDTIKKMEEAQKGMAGMGQGMGGMSQGMAGMGQGMAGTSQGMGQGMAGMGSAVTEMKKTITEMTDLSSKMTALKDAIPGAFETAKENYVAEIKKKGPQIESTFQSTINGGFKNVYLTSAIAAVIAELVLLLYRKKKEIV